MIMLSLCVLLVSEGQTLLTCFCDVINESMPLPCNTSTHTCSGADLCGLELLLNDGVLSKRWLCLSLSHDPNSNNVGVNVFCMSKPSASSVYQCCNYSFCNKDLLNTTLDLPTEHTYTLVSPLPQSPATGSNGIFAIFAAIPIIALVVTAVALFVCIVYKHPKRSSVPSTSIDLHHMTAQPYSLDSVQDGMTCTSGSGSGLPFLIQRTVARNIRLGDPIGTGRYGQVFMGHYQGETVAVKKFASRDEQSWVRETEIYSIVLLRHENILGYIASDMVSNSGVTELWLITQYHSNGSLYDYLSYNTIDCACMVQLMLSICNGLTHLHTELFGTQGKPAIAHRDMKSRNILVKANLTCCIADFGLAVMKVRQKSTMNLPTNPKQGTRRYMAPEILNDSINTLSFESFKQVDIYAVGLVMWEICRRTSSDTGQCEEYELPFQGMVPPDPSLEDMRAVVVDEKKQPVVPNRWTSDELLASVVELMRECWYPNPLARPTALYLKKKLLRLAMEDNKRSYA
ncbi:hypothetical protein EMCRGX_G017464 [Ephydatia muelleri]|eukprot:Em0012g9a